MLTGGGGIKIDQRFINYCFLLIVYLNVPENPKYMLTLVSSKEKQFLGGLPN